MTDEKETETEAFPAELKAQIERHVYKLVSSLVWAGQEMKPAAGSPAETLFAGLQMALDDYEQIRWPLGKPKEE